MDQTYPQMLQLAGKTILVTATAAFEVIAAPEVLVAVGTGEASYAALEALGSIKAVSREEATMLGAEERARFGGSVAAMRASGHLESPFQNPAYVNSLPTQAQIMAIAPHPVPMNAPSIAHTPTSPTDHVTTYPGLAPPIDELHLPRTAGQVGPFTTPNAGPIGIDDLDSRPVPYVNSSTLAAGRAALAKLDKCEPGFESFKSFSSLQRALDSPPGWEDHHIVEQSRGTPLFGTEVIQNTSNVIPLPPQVHGIISKQYSSAFQDATGHEWSHYRDYMQQQPFERQRQLGMDAVKGAINEAEHRGTISADLADRLRSDLAKLDRPELCVPTPPKINPADLLPSIEDLNKAIDGHNQQSDRQLPNVRSVAQWDGSTRSGTFVDIGNGLVAQHQGRGDYAVADVQQQLGGQMPPLGQYATLQQNGQVQIPQHAQSLQRG